MKTSAIPHSGQAKRYSATMHDLNAIGQQQR
jgi:hypothetical protein